jgi:hypothetical protein
LFTLPGSQNRWVLGYRSVYLVDATGRVLRTLDTTAQGQTFGFVQAAAVAADGSIALESNVDEGVFGIFQMGPEPIVVTVFSKSGSPVATWNAFDGMDGASERMAIDDARVAYLVRPDDSGKPPSVLVTDLHGKPQFRFAPPISSEHPRKPAKVFLVKRGDASEPWLYDGESMIDRYAMR